MQKRTLVERLLALQKGGDEPKLVRFENKLNKYLTAQETMRKNNIETLKDKISDANEAVREAIENVTASQLAATDDVERYVASYVTLINERLNKVEDYEQQIKQLEDEILRLVKVKEAIYVE